MIGELSKMLKELNRWRASPLKRQMVKISRERITLLRDLINEWLASTNLD